MPVPGSGSHKTKNHYRLVAKANLAVIRVRQLGRDYECIEFVMVSVANQVETAIICE